MSGLARWSLGIGVVLVIVAVALVAADLITPGVIAGMLGLAALVLGGYEALDGLFERLELRRRARRPRRHL